MLLLNNATKFQQSDLEGTQDLMSLLDNLGVCLVLNQL